jgi:NADH-quinone oxidoreductase subunit H
MFQLTEYASMWAFSVFGSVVFLGGWAWPFGLDAAWPVQLGTTLVKSIAFILAIFWVRTTVPRLRIDQLMSFCWKVLLPMSLVQLLMNGVILIYDWPQELLGVSSALGAAALIAIVIRRAIKRPSKDLMGTYKTLGVATQ